MPSISLANAAAGVVGRGSGGALVADVAALVADVAALVADVAALVADVAALVDEHPASATVAPASPPASRALRSRRPPLSMGGSSRSR
ncbi:hypothetical protein AB0950_33560 [Streptomyces sp. NPDC007189]|uniref:hypothetical protein n=1 Tax=Streptomyces sp. NPDC007189 TaxID=3154315 RepID=UPI003456D66A